MDKNQPRKLAVILHADVVGSTLLVHQNETLAHERIQATFHKFSEIINSYHGITHELRGDALVAEFPRASDALAASLSFQVTNDASNATFDDDVKPRVRVGISLGEVVIADNTITGAGVVLAQRLEQLAEPGGVCIQGAAYETVPQRLPFVYENLGDQQVKGFEEPVRAYTVNLKPGEPIPSPEPTRQKIKVNRQVAMKFRQIVGAMVILAAIGIAVVLWQPWTTIMDSSSTQQTASSPEKQPSIAVLPFQTLSDEATQDYFSDGVTNDIITDLSKFSNLLVIASNSVFTYKGKPVIVKDVGRELGVRYVLEGSVQKSGNRVRINAQLIDAETDHHLWADRYDFEIDDIFKIQDEITSTVVTSLQVVLTENEKNLEAIHLTDSLEAYDLYLRGKTYLKGTRKAHLEARKLFDKAIKLDPGFSAAHAEKSFTFFSSFIMPMSRDPRVVKGALEAALKAVEADDMLPLAHARLAWAYFSNREHAKAIASARRAVALGPNDAEAHAQLGNILNWSGKPNEGKLNIERAMRLNPYYPYYYLFYLGQSHYLLNENEKAIELMNRVVTRAPYFLPVRRHLAVLYAEKGMMQEAKDQTREVLRIFPGASIEDERARCFYRWEPDLMNRFFSGLRKSGMPEGRAGEEPMSM
ncbi:MAG: tetratricopeptide repeat protein [Gammaproteobacteria bacterium]|nr:MAG: tetratricopeptide repeat protein [Gammaproteobacteria bacterium]